MEIAKTHTMEANSHLLRVKREAQGRNDLAALLVIVE